MSTKEITSLEQLERQKLSGFSGGTELFPSSDFTNTWHTEGIQTLCEEAECFWILDVISTEFYEALEGKRPDSFYLTIAVKNSKCDMIMVDYEDNVLHKRHVPYTDLVPGKLTLYIGWDGSRMIICLIPEH